MSCLSHAGPGLTVPLSITGLRAHGPLLLVPLVAAACVALAMSLASPESQDTAESIQDETVKSDRDCVEPPPPTILPASLWRSFTEEGQKRVGGSEAHHGYHERGDSASENITETSRETKEKFRPRGEEDVANELDFGISAGPSLRLPARRLDLITSEGPKSRFSNGIQCDSTNRNSTPAESEEVPLMNRLFSPEARSALRANAKAFVPTHKRLRPEASPFAPGRVGLRATTPVINRIYDSRLRADAPKFSPKRKSRRIDAVSSRKALRAGAPAFTPGRVGFRVTSLVLSPRKTLRADAPPFTPGPLAEFGAAKTPSA